MGEREEKEELTRRIREHGLQVGDHVCGKVGYLAGRTATVVSFDDDGDLNVKLDADASTATWFSSNTMRVEDFHLESSAPPAKRRKIDHQQGMDPSEDENIDDNI